MLETNLTTRIIEIGQELQQLHHREAELLQELADMNVAPGRRAPSATTKRAPVPQAPGHVAMAGKEKGRPGRAPHPKKDRVIEMAAANKSPLEIAKTLGLTLAIAKGIIYRARSKGLLPKE